jgi:hypothetical protein
LATCFGLHADRHEVFLGVVVQLETHRRRERVAVDMGHEQGVAITGLLADVVGRNHTGGTGLVLDHHRQVPHGGELLAHHPRQRIRAAARRKAHNDAHRPAGQGLGVKHRRGQGGGGCGHKCSSLHGLSPFMNEIGMSPA